MIRVLVVDDEPSLREMLRMVLESEGYEVASARHGGDAIAQLEAGLHPDIMLLDILMPVVDGFGVCEWLSKHLLPIERPHVVILSASLPPGLQPPAADAMLTKPFNIDTVLDIVERLSRTTMPAPLLSSPPLIASA